MLKIILDGDAIRRPLQVHIAWINRHRRTFQAQDRQPKREYVSGETHYFLGRGYRLQLNRGGRSYRIRIAGSGKLEFSAPADASCHQREQAILRWHRRELRKRVEVEAKRWAARLGIPIPIVGIKRMRTKWGTSNPSAKRIWLNLELAQKSPQSISYIVLHELVHFLHRKHDENFVAQLDALMPKWRSIRAELNQSPLAYQPWYQIEL